MPDDKEPKFDPDFSRHHEINREAARVRNLRFSLRHDAYVDEDGCPVRDRFGQPL